MGWLRTYMWHLAAEVPLKMRDPSPTPGSTAQCQEEEFPLEPMRSKVLKIQTSS